MRRRIAELEIEPALIELAQDAQELHLERPLRLRQRGQPRAQDLLVTVGKAGRNRFHGFFIHLLFQPPPDAVPRLSPMRRRWFSSNRRPANRNAAERILLAS